MPADFSADPPDSSPDRDAIGAPTIQMILLKNMTDATVQIMVTRDLRDAPSDTLTTEDIEQQAPYLDLSEAEAIQITPIITGVMFTDTKLPIYGTSTDEVWFEPAPEI